MEPQIRIQEGTSPAPGGPTDAVRIVASSLRVEGATIFPETELIALTGFRPIAVSEGRLGNVQLRNRSNLASSIVDSDLAGLQPGDVLAIAPVETRLLLLSDLPGVNVSSTLVRGALPGTSDLIVDVAQGQRVTGSRISGHPRRWRRTR
jgi:hypothetical protein